MGTYKSFKSDETSERAGVWLDLGEAGQFKLARAGGSNKAYVKLMSRKTRPIRRQIQTDTLSQEAGQKMLVDVYARTIILDWKGVTDEEENELAFSYENCVKLMTDLPDLFREIHEAAMEASLFREYIVEEDTKN